MKVCLQGRSHAPKAAKYLRILNTILLVGGKKGGEAPKYVQTGCNKCFQRYTPESWVLKGKDRSVTGGASSETPLGGGSLGGVVYPDP